MTIEYDTLALEYAKHRQVHPEVVKGLISDGAVSQSSQVLEVGSGTGNYIIALEQATGCKSWGIVHYGTDYTFRNMSLCGRKPCKPFSRE